MKFRNNELALESENGSGIPQALCSFDYVNTFTIRRTE